MAGPVGYEVTGPNGERGWWDGKKITPLGANGMAAAKLAPVEQKSVDEAQSASRNALDVLSDLTRFQDINKATGTGALGSLPIVKQVRNALDPNYQQLGEISARLTPAQRQAGSGTTSDRDLALYAQAVPGVNRSRTANDAIIERSRAEAVRRQQYADFLDQYAAKNGTLKGAESAFRATVGLGTKQNPYPEDMAGDRSTLPRGAYYRSKEGLRRNDNGPRGNPIIDAAQAPKVSAKTSGQGWKIISVE